MDGGCLRQLPDGELPPLTARGERSSSSTIITSLV
jgi:hypothetical protein